MIRRQCRVLALAVVLAATATPALAGGFFLDYVGGKGSAMGNAFAARPDDATAIFHNPAGLTLLEQSEVLLDARVFILDSSYEPAYGVGESHTVSDPQLAPNADFATKLGNLSVGFGFHTPYGTAIEYNDGWGRYQVKEVDLRTLFFTPAAAYPITPCLSIGAGLSYVYATMEQSLAVPYPPAAGNPDYDITASLEAEDSFGLGWNVGTMFHKNGLYVGLAYFRPPDLDFEGDARVVLPPALGGTVIDNKVTGLQMNLCDWGRLGVGYEFGEKAFAQIELDYIGWGRLDEYEVEFEQHIPGTPYAENLVSERNWESTWGIRVGGEYYLLPALALRAGYEYDETNIPDETYDLTVPDSDKHVVTVGAGTNVGPMVIDFAWVHHFLKDRTVDEHVDPTKNALYAGDYESQLDIIHLTLGYKF